MTSLVVLVLVFATVASAANDHLWNYGNDQFGGPEFWGLVDKRWEMCHKGKLQSPIDIAPDRLLFDPGLRPIHVDRVTVASELVNTGQMPRVRIGNSARRSPANLSGGPLNNYRYRIQRIDIHYGRDGLPKGSEHSIDGKRFPMELQLLAFNTDLYANFSLASRSPNGIAAISVLVDIGQETNDELQKLTIATASVASPDQRVELADLKPWALLPVTRDFVTYQGSMTSPGCHETVTWIVVNQPIYITSNDLTEWGRLLTRTDKTSEPAYLAPNSRPLQKLNGRLLRTNIQHKTVNPLQADDECNLPLTRLTYRSNVVTSGGGSAPTNQRSIPAPVSKHKKRHTAHKQLGHDQDLFL